MIHIHAVFANPIPRIIANLAHYSLSELPHGTSPHAARSNCSPVRMSHDNPESDPVHHLIGALTLQVALRSGVHGEPTGEKLNWLYVYGLVQNYYLSEFGPDVGASTSGYFRGDLVG